MTAPRLYCIPARDAPVIAVLRRGPSKWSHVGRWTLDPMGYEPGAWLRGRLFPRRSDLSFDGRYLCYFAHKSNARWAEGETYVAVARLPWLYALHAFGTCGTWTRGYHFTSAQDPERIPEVPVALRATRVEQFATERRHGWSETEDCPPRERGGPWDEHRYVRLVKPRPTGGARLFLARVEHGAQEIDAVSVDYTLARGDGAPEPLDAQWADWDTRGRLLVATRSGRLQIRDFDSVLFDYDLASLEPAPSAAPEWARTW